VISRPFARRAAKAIIITEIPPSGETKAAMVEGRIADPGREQKIEGIADLRDEVR